MPAAAQWAELRGVRARLVAAADEGRPGARNRGERLLGLRHPAGLRRVALGSDDHEVVVHHVVPRARVPLGHELVLRRARVHEHRVGVAVPSDCQRLAGPDRHDVHAAAALFLEVREDRVEQPRVLRAGRRRQPKDILLGGAGRERGATAQRGRDEQPRDRVTHVLHCLSLSSRGSTRPGRVGRASGPTAQPMTCTRRARGCQRRNRERGSAELDTADVRSHYAAAEYLFRATLQFSSPCSPPSANGTDEGGLSRPSSCPAARLAPWALGVRDLRSARDYPARAARRGRRETGPDGR